MNWLKRRKFQLYLFVLCLMTNVSVPVLHAQTELVYLSGTGADHRVDWDFFCSRGRNSGKWTKIPVPSCWEQEGFGGYYYGYGTGDRLSETGTYRHQFYVPAAWKGKEIRIVFEGVMTDALVKINNKIAGDVHQGAFYEFSYEISSLLQYGHNNSLEVLVKKHSDNKSVNHAERDADYWVFGGIFRPVYLQVKPKQNIDRVAIDARADGVLNAAVLFSDHVKSGKLKLELFDKNGDKLQESDHDIKGTDTRIQTRLANPSLWTAETPVLYKARFTLLGAKGQPIHSTEEKFGFRTVEIRESDGIYVNGIRVKLKGVNRHTFHPRYGRTSSKAMSIEAVNLIKDMNMNAVRMSHYPPDKHFLDVCDSLGLFVLNELAGWQRPTYDDTVGRKLIREMVIRDQNHPSIILWDNGNEGGWNNNLNEEFAKWDLQKREVIHPWEDFGKFNNYHYMDYNYLSNDGFNRRKIFMPTEFLHGLYDGGHGAGLEDFWLRMWNDPLCSGGFLWVFADEAVERSDKNGALDTYGNEAPDGIVGPYHEKEGSFYTIREVWSPVYFEKKYITPDFDGIFRIENRYHYTDLKDCRFVAEWVHCANPNQPLGEQIGFREVFSVPLQPEQKGKIQLNKPASWLNFDLLRIKAWDPTGRLIHEWSWAVKTARTKTEELLKMANQSGGSNNVNAEPNFSSGVKPLIQETDSYYGIKTRELEMRINKSNGQLIRIIKAGKEIPLGNGPVFVDNKKELESVRHLYHNDTLIIESLFKGGDFFRWIIAGQSSVIKLEAAYEPSRYSKFAGISFSYPEDQVAAAKWMGDGPYRVYKNRMKGVGFGLWEKAYNNTVTGESGYVYPEFKGYHSNLYWLRLQNKQTPDFTIYVHTDDIFLKLFTPQEPARPERAKMVYPEGDLSFLHIINGIGDKFLEPEKLGPQSNPVLFNKERLHLGKLHLSLSFDFN
ncbi:MAG TPA: glycoside hydrolase family 2 TIM barrel-domain containing protein [Flavihumibacter sp.]